MGRHADFDSAPLRGGSVSVDRVGYSIEVDFVVAQEVRAGAHYGTHIEGLDDIERAHGDGLGPPARRLSAGAAPTFRVKWRNEMTNAISAAEHADRRARLSEYVRTLGAAGYVVC